MTFFPRFICLNLIIFTCWVAPWSYGLEIAIIGAGSAGLTAAHYLKSRHSITVFEAGSTVGGKANTVLIDGTSVELGAILFTPKYKVINELKTQYGVQSGIWPSNMFFIDDNGELHPYNESLGNINALQSLLESKKFLDIFKTYKELDDPELGPVQNEDLFLPFKKFALKYGFMDILPNMTMALTVSGYSFPEKIPALYALRLLKLYIKPMNNYIYRAITPYLGIQQRFPFDENTLYFPEGFTHLWEKVAAAVRINYNSKVIEVRSLDSGQVELKIEDGRTFNFDRVLVATNIKDAPSFLPLEKNELFHKIEKKVKTIRYLVTVFKTTQLFSHRTIFFYSHMNAKLINRTQGILQFVKDPHLFIAYQILDDKISWQEAQVILENDLRDQLGVTEMWVRLQKEWSYFPHIPVENLNNDILGDIRKLQGQGGIYFVGSSWSSENVENAAEHAKFVCDNYFP